MRTFIEQIPGGNYTGYYWMSDSEMPVVVKGEFPSTLLSQSLPFIVEGNLYDAKNNQSFSIRHNGSNPVVCQYNLNELSGCEKNPVAFIAHRLPGKGRVKFWELWKEEKDSMCEGLNTLRPFVRVFVGFEENNQDIN